MKRNPIYSALSIVLRNTGRNLQILKYGLIENGWLRMTDLDHEIKVFVGDQGTEPLLVDVGLLLKIDDLPAAIDAAQIMNVDDFPGKFDTGLEAIEISAGVLDGLVDLIPAASTDDSRECLKHVFVNRKKKEAVATDGHVLLSLKLWVLPRESFMIDPISLKIAACFPGNVTKLSIRHRKETKGADGKMETSAIDFLTLSGNRWQLISRVPNAKEYPLYWKAIPDRAKAIPASWDKGLTGEVSAFVEKSMPLANPKTHLVHFTAGEGIVRNKELSYLRNTVFSREVLPLKPEQVIGLNGEILQYVLKFIGDRNVSVTVGDLMTQAVVFKGEDCQALIMPLRTAESGSGGITRAELMQVKAPVAEAENGAGIEQAEMKKAA
jgi:hypothetical protein